MKVLYKVTKEVLNIITVILICTSLISVATIFLNIQTFYVKSGSMSPTIPIKSLVFINRNATDFEAGDIVAFYPDEGKRFVVTHRIVSQDPDGFYSTKGDANDENDLSRISSRNIIGKYVFNVPGLGVVMAYKRQWAPFFCAFLVTLICINNFAQNSIRSIDKNQTT